MQGKRLVIALVVALALCLVLAGTAMAMSSASYNLPWEVLSGGGGSTSSTSYWLSGTAGQPVTGISHSASYRMESGFWTGSAPSAPAPLQPGDANGDGDLNAVDITKVERIIAGLDLQTEGSDANRDGEVNALDITKVERLIAGLDLT